MAFAAQPGVLVAAVLLVLDEAGFSKNLDVVGDRRFVKAGCPVSRAAGVSSAVGEDLEHPQPLRVARGRAAVAPALGVSGNSDTLTATVATRLSGGRRGLVGVNSCLGVLHHDVADSGGGEGGGGLVADGGVGSVVVVVDEPALKVVGALGLAGPGSGVGELRAEG
jgi:hypothetical protein